MTLARLNEVASLRELAHLYGVNHDVLYRLLHGHGCRPATLRRIQEGIAGSREAEAFDRLEAALRDLCPRGSDRLRLVEGMMADAAERVLRRAGKIVPSWVRWLREGKRTPLPANESVRRWVDAVRGAQAGSEGGKRAMRGRLPRSADESSRRRVISAVSGKHAAGRPAARTELIRRPVNPGG